MGLPSSPELTTQGDFSTQEQADIDLLYGLVSVESLSNGEASAVAWLRDQMAARGMHVIDDAAGNAVATVGSGDRHVVLLGHIDTVPGRIPVQIRDGVLWGRGAVDAKGPLATFVAAASAAADQLNARVTVVGAVGEEIIGSPGANEVAKWDGPDLCVIGEPSGWDAICLGYRGSLSLVYTLHQSTRHTAGPGESVAEEAVQFWNTLRAELDRWNADAKNSFGSIGHSLRAFNTSGDGLTDVAKLSIGLRLPPELDVALLAGTHSHARGSRRYRGRRCSGGIPHGQAKQARPAFLASDSRGGRQAALHPQARDVGHECGGPCLEMPYRGVWSWRLVA